MSIENMSQRQNSEIENGASLSVAPSISGKAVPKAAGPVGSHAFQPKYQKLMVQHYSILINGYINGHNLIAT